MNIEQTLPHVVLRLFGLGIRDTVVTTWIIMLVVVCLAWLGARRWEEKPRSLQNFLESIVELLDKLIAEVRHLRAENEKLVASVKHWKHEANVAQDNMNFISQQGRDWR